MKVMEQQDFYLKHNNKSAAATTKPVKQFFINKSVLFVYKTYLARWRIFFQTMSS